MRKPNVSVLLIITLIFAAFTLGFFLGRNPDREEITVSVPDRYRTAPTLPLETDIEPSETEQVVVFPISLNQAEKEGQVVPCDDLPKSFILTDEYGMQRIFLTSLSASTLEKRMK